MRLEESPSLVLLRVIGKDSFDASGWTEVLAVEGVKGAAAVRRGGR